MAKGRRQFTRPLDFRTSRKLFIIVAEGKKTEPQYFGLLNNRRSTTRVTCLESGNSPAQLLERIREYLKDEGLKDSDEAWIALDKDHWPDKLLEQLHEWSVVADNYGLALSNPMFEFWLLLHFEEGDGVSTRRKCMERLKVYIPNYNKEVKKNKFPLDKIKEAVHRAKKLDNPLCPDWPRQAGTTVYRLVENILKRD